jgi:hypothetical protein
LCRRRGRGWRRWRRDRRTPRAWPRWRRRRGRSAARAGGLRDEGSVRGVDGGVNCGGGQGASPCNWMVERRGPRPGWGRMVSPVRTGVPQISCRFLHCAGTPAGEWPYRDLGDFLSRPRGMERHRQSPDVFPFDRLPGLPPLRRDYRRRSLGHQVGLAALVSVVDQCGRSVPAEPLPVGAPPRLRLAARRGLRARRTRCPRAGSGWLRRGLLQDRGESDRPERCCGATAGPVVDLARRVAGDACEGGLAEVGAGEDEQGGEFGV